MAGRPAEALELFEQVAAIAERFDDADLRTSDASVGASR